jgi:hypothetical protein
MNKSTLLTTIFFLICIVNLFSQDTLRRENGVVYFGIPLITSPNTVDGFGSADGGDFGTDYVYSYIEINDSYNGVNMENSTWMSYGDLLPIKFPDAIEIGLGFFPDTFIWAFHTDTLFVEVKDAETTMNQEYTFIYETFDGANPGPLDSLFIAETDGTLTEPSIIQVFPDMSTSIIETAASYDFNISPNPSKDDAIIEYSLSEASNVVINIIGIDGKNYFKSSSSYQAKGEHRFEINHPLPFGLYIIQLQINDSIISRKWLRI